jgi:protein-S-isoprenylcysteine O-methyltransferase Ste14
MLAVWGAPTMTGDRGWFAALSSIYLVVAMRWEEAAMRRVFGDAYDRYRARVPYRVLPGIY